VEHEYFRCGAWTYIAGLDVHHARIFGRCEPKNGIQPFDRLVEQVMTRPPYNDARRVFWIVDNCSAHRGTRAVERLQRAYPQLVPAEAVELRRRSAKYTLPYFQVQRAKIILMAAEGLENSEIAARLNTRRDVVSEWRKRFFLERLAGLEERSRPGRPRTFSP
jgi:hypothetical protein